MRFVFGAFADDNLAPKINGVELRAHRINGSFIRELRFTFAYPLRSGDGRHLRHPDKLERKIVERGAAVGFHVPSGYPAKRQRQGDNRRTYLIFTILYFCAPLGVSNANVSPRFLSISAEPSGERCEILCSCIFASAEPTISYVCSSFSPCFCIRSEERRVGKE